MYMNLRAAFDTPSPAIVLAEGKFGETGGKTANGVVMHSEVFDVGAVIDSTRAGQAVSEVLGRDDVPNVPIVSSVSEALEAIPDAKALIIGVAPAGGALPAEWVDEIQAAMCAGCDIVSGLHVFLSEDPNWCSVANEHGVRLFDVRKPPEDEVLQVADGRIDDVDETIVLVAGTDCAIGKRTTTFELYRAAIDAGLDAGWVATGQTGIMIGSHRGVAIDRVPADFTAGVVEDHVCAVAEEHDVVFVEGQACLTHRAYSGVTLSILHGSWPDVVVLADEPGRDVRTLFEQFTVDGVETEIEHIERLSEASVVALSTWGEPNEEAQKYELPAANVYHEGGPELLLEYVMEAV